MLEYMDEHSTAGKVACQSELILASSKAHREPTTFITISNQPYPTNSPHLTSHIQPPSKRHPWNHPWGPPPPGAARPGGGAAKPGAPRFTAGDVDHGAAALRAAGAA